MVTDWLVKLAEITDSAPLRQLEQSRYFAARLLAMPRSKRLAFLTEHPGILQDLTPEDRTWIFATLRHEPELRVSASMEGVPDDEDLAELYRRREPGPIDATLTYRDR